MARSPIVGSVVRGGVLVGAGGVFTGAGGAFVRLGQCLRERPHPVFVRLGQRFRQPPCLAVRLP
ncbi:hypothetical protein ACFXPM_11160 [Streptomyces sp. NPDC059095]|uniref:hypothetical protein n=1 Tax=Streptomyces sp. NPDC059095 TaxID=3346726 RepID=UPI003685378B